MSDVGPLEIAWGGRGFWLRRGGLVVHTADDLGSGLPRRLPRPSLVLGGSTSQAEVRVERLPGAAWLLDWSGDRIGVAADDAGWEALRGADAMQVALVPNPELGWGLSARYALPGRGDGVDGPRGVQLRPGEVATFTGTGEELFLYCVEPFPGSRADRWGWLLRRLRPGRPPASR